MILCMPDRQLSVTAAARNFADAVNRAYYRNETTVLLKNGVPVARIAPIAARGRPGVELAAEWDRLAHLSAAEAAGFAADIAGARDAIQLPPAAWD
jgi:antitoxin (DNA-binding transcriptional repressor) of toxin-antitoxin stability system